MSESPCTIVVPARVLGELERNPETWDRTELFCQECGKKEVWALRLVLSPDEYIEGFPYLCAACGGAWTLQQGVGPATGLNADILKVIRDAIGHRTPSRNAARTQSFHAA